MRVALAENVAGNDQYVVLDGLGDERRRLAAGRGHEGIERALGLDQAQGRADAAAAKAPAGGDQAKAGIAAKAGKAKAATAKGHAKAKKEVVP